MKIFILPIVMILFPVLSTVADERPSFVLVMCDDLGWGDVGFNGGERINTPFLDAMARNSMRFTRFYAHAPVCSPTRGSCLTGRHPFRYGIYFANSGHMKKEEYTLAEILRELGYATGHFGKWHLGTMSSTVVDSNRGGRPQHRAHVSPPQDNGFDVCFSTEAKVPTYDPMLKPAVAAGNAWDSLTDKSSAIHYGTHYWNERGEIVNENLDGDNSRIIMDRAIPFIERAVAKDVPFFAVVWFHTPHLPVVAGPEYRKPYEQHSVAKRNYYGCVTAMDAQVGRLRARLSELGIAENTMVCFCSDNGPEGNSTAPGSAGPFRGRKRSLYEGGIRVPSLVCWPKRIPSGCETDFPAVTSDYLPTILDAVGLELPSRPMDGISLLPVIKGTMKKRPRPIAFQSRGQVALSGHQYKLIRGRDKSEWELCDLLQDKSERHNLALTHPAIVQSMRTSLEQWQQSCQDSDSGGDY